MNPTLRKLCDQLNIRHQGLLDVTVNSTGAIRATYTDRNSFWSNGKRTVIWLDPPARPCP